MIPQESRLPPLNLASTADDSSDDLNFDDDLVLLESKDVDTPTSLSRAAVTVGPLNTLATQSIVMLSAGPRLLPVHGSQPAAGTQPVWLLHDETGQACDSVRRLLAAYVDHPVYGINIGTSVLRVSMDALVESYATAIMATQATHPYALVGCGPVGCTFAHAGKQVSQRACTHEYVSICLRQPSS